MTFERLTRILDGLGCREVLVKRLAPNDNSKNQPYIAKDRELSGFSILPASEFTSVDRNFHAQVDFSWIADDGNAYPAPGTKLIQYGRYNPPEVRLSGFLRGCERPPTELMTTRAEGRILILGVAGIQVFGYVTAPGTDIAHSVLNLLDSSPSEFKGALQVLPVAGATAASTIEIAAHLHQVHEAGWISGRRLVGNEVIPHWAQNAGGMTLEAALGVSSNSESGPDFLGWELKAVSTNSLDRLPVSKAVTLITPGPDDGTYRSAGAAHFLRKFGQPSTDRSRIDFTGVHRVGSVAQRTGSVLELRGYSPGEVPSPDGAISLRMRDGSVGASWSFTRVLEMWNRKHARTVYVPYIRDTAARAFRFSEQAMFCENSSFGLLLDALSDGYAYYDPGMNMKDPEGLAALKLRHQFRIKFAEVPRLYERATIYHMHGRGTALEPDNR